MPCARLLQTVSASDSSSDCVHVLYLFSSLNAVLAHAPLPRTTVPAISSNKVTDSGSIRIQGYAHRALSFVAPAFGSYHHLRIINADGGSRNRSLARTRVIC